MCPPPLHLSCLLLVLLIGNIHTTWREERRRKKKKKEEEEEEEEDYLRAHLFLPLLLLLIATVLEPVSNLIVTLVGQVDAKQVPLPPLSFSPLLFHHFCCPFFFSPCHRGTHISLALSPPQNTDGG